jgi:hypothetical protein
MVAWGGVALARGRPAYHSTIRSIPNPAPEMTVANKNRSAWICRLGTTVYSVYAISWKFSCRVPGLPMNDGGVVKRVNHGSTGYRIQRSLGERENWNVCCFSEKFFTTMFLVCTLYFSSLSRWFSVHRCHHRSHRRPRRLTHINKFMSSSAGIGLIGRSAA